MLYVANLYKENLVKKEINTLNLTRLLKSDSVVQDSILI